MRKVERIDGFMDFIKHIWKTKCPDWRFGQFISNVMSEITAKHGDIFFPEEDVMEKYVAEVFDTTVEDVKKEMLRIEEEEHHTFRISVILSYRDNLRLEEKILDKDEVFEKITSIPDGKDIRMIVTNAFAKIALYEQETELVSITLENKMLGEWTLVYGDRTYIVTIGAEKPEKRTFLIPVVYSVYGRIPVKGIDAQDAIMWAQSHVNELPLPDDGEYLEDSFEVDKDGIVYDDEGNTCD